jgi:hypothetical protein
MTGGDSTPAPPLRSRFDDVEAVDLAQQILFRAARMLGQEDDGEGRSAVSRNRP